MLLEFLQPHTHAGVLHAAGTALEIPDATARWLIDRGVARPVVPPSTLETPASENKASTPSRKGE